MMSVTPDEPQLSRCLRARASVHPARPLVEYAYMSPEFTLLYDSECPFCKLEVEWLQKRDGRGRLGAIDIAAAGCDAASGADADL